MITWQDDKRWSDLYIPEVKRIVGPRLLEPAPFEMDVLENTDLLILIARDMKIAVRIRRPEYYVAHPPDYPYRYEFTIRSERESGSPTELAKIIQGFGDWFFYGFGGQQPPVLLQWSLLDLEVFRLEYSSSWIVYNDRNNRDGTHFRSYKARSFRGNLVIASSHPERMTRSITPG